MIVEITGIPCSGKTTLIRRAAATENPQFIYFTDKTVCGWLRLSPTSKTIEKMISEFVIFCFSFKSIYKFNGTIYCFLKKLFHMSDSLLNKLNLFRNLLLKFGRFEFATSIYCKELVVFDEGLSHIPFNFVDLGNNGFQDENDPLDPLRKIYSRINLIMINHEGIDVQTRLVDRGHRRVDTSKREEVQKFFQANCRMYSIIKNNSSYFKSCNVLNEVTPKGLLTLIGEISING